MANLNQQESIDNQALERFAKKLFAAGGAIQAIAMLVNGLIFFYVDYQWKLNTWMSWRHRPVNSYWEYLQDYHHMEILGAFAVGSVIYCAVACLIGAAAGSSLIAGRRSLLGMSLQAAVIPAFLAAAGMLVANLTFLGKLDRIGDREGEEFFQVWVVLFLFYFIPGTVMGMLSGVLLRRKETSLQEKRRLHMREDWDLDTYQRA